MMTDTLAPLHKKRRGVFSAVRASVILAVIVMMLGGLSASAYAGPNSQAGCDDTGGGLWQSMKNRADAQRVRDSAYNRMVRQPDSAVAATCFDLALALSARLGNIFADIAGSLNLNLPTGWADLAAAIRASAIVSIGKATPEFFPPGLAPPPLANLVNGVMGSLDASLGGKLAVYNPFAGFGGLRVKLDTGLIDINSLLHIYFKTFEMSLDLNDYLPNFRFSIGFNLGANVTGVLGDLVAMLNLNLPTIPKLNMPCVIDPTHGQPCWPDLGAAFSTMICGSMFSAALGFYAGPGATLLGMLDDAGAVWQDINLVIEGVNTAVSYLEFFVSTLSAVLGDLMASANALASAQASLAGINWPTLNLNLPIPWLAPGCLLSLAIWAGKKVNKQFDEATNTISTVLEDIDGRTTGTNTAEPVPPYLTTSNSDPSAPGQPYTPVNPASIPLTPGGSSGMDATTIQDRGITGGGNFGRVVDNPSMNDMPFFTMADMVHGTIQGAGPELVTQVMADGTVSVTGEFSTSVNAGILARAALDLDINLSGPSITMIDSWKEPPVVDGRTMSSCEIILQMPPLGPTTGDCQ